MQNACKNYYIFTPLKLSNYFDHNREVCGYFSANSPRQEKSWIFMFERFSHESGTQGSFLASYQTLPYHLSIKNISDLQLH